MGWLRSVYPAEDLNKLFKLETGKEMDEVFAREFLTWVEERYPKKRKFKTFADLHRWVSDKMHLFFDEQVACG